MSFTNVPYLQNNITFRIASADAVSKFKAAQAHAFIQVSRREFEFGTTAREALLLSYDRFSIWVVRVERLFLSSTDNELTDELKGYIIDDLCELFGGIEDVLKTHGDIFDAQSVAYIKLIHAYSFKFISQAILSDQSRDICGLYTNMLSLLTLYLQHLLIALHEYNNNVTLKKQPFFICFSEFSRIARDEDDHCCTAQRANFFKTEYGLKKFIIKNYIGDEAIDVKIINKLVALGVEILPENR